MSNILDPQFVYVPAASSDTTKRPWFIELQATNEAYRKEKADERKLAEAQLRSARGSNVVSKDGA